MPKSTKSTVLTKKHQARLEREKIQRRYIMIVALTILIAVVGLIGYGILEQTVLIYQKPVAQVGADTINLQDFQVRVKYERWNQIRNYEYNSQMMQLFGSDESNQSYFTNALQQIQTQLDNTSGFGHDILDQMEDEVLIRQEAQKRNIVVSKEEVDKAMEAAFGYEPNGTPTPTITPTYAPTSTLSEVQLAMISTPTPLAPPTDSPEPSPTPTENVPTVEATPTAEGAATATLTPVPSVTPTATPYTFEGYQKQKTDYLEPLATYGYNEEYLRKVFENQLLKEKVLAAVTADVPTEEDQVWARHILVEDQATADTIYEELQKGGDWFKLAAERSTDTGNKDEGGDLGWFGKGVMDKDFEDAAFKLKIGEISKPVKSQFGYHIIQVIGHEVRQLDETELDDARQTKFDEWLADAREAANVQEFDILEKNIPTEPALSPE